MALVKKLLNDYPIPKAEDGSVPPDHVDVGENTPFELAAMYKIWQTLMPRRTDRGREDGRWSRIGTKAIIRMGG